MSTDRDYRWLMVSSNPVEAQRQRLSLIEETFDGQTIELLDRVDLTGSVVLEIGAGAGSIADELSRRVGTEGQVTAVDLDVSHLDSVSGNVRIEQRDLRLDHDFGDSTVDFIHCRSVLAFLAERDAILASLIRAVRPGGHIFLEEVIFDEPKYVSDQTPEILASFLVETFPKAIANSGASLQFGAQLPFLLADAGLDISFTHRTSRSGSNNAPYTRLMVATIMAMRDAMVEAELADDAAVDDVLDCLTTTNLPIPAGEIVSTLARKLV